MPELILGTKLCLKRPSFDLTHIEIASAVFFFQILRDFFVRRGQLLVNPTWKEKNKQILAIFIFIWKNKYFFIHKYIFCFVILRPAPHGISLGEYLNIQTFEQNQVSAMSPCQS